MNADPTMERNDHSGSGSGMVKAPVQPEASAGRGGQRCTALGLCVGASSIKVVEVERDHGLRVMRTHVVHHGGAIQDSLEVILADFPPAQYDFACVTGRKFKDLVNLPAITETEAAEYALRHTLSSGHTQPCDAQQTTSNKEQGECDNTCHAPPATLHRYRSLISLGAENFVLYELDEEGVMIDVRTGGKCASGTGEFFVQQVGRMGLDLEKAGALAEQAEPYMVSGRCSVFCKSDCTHALNKGVPRERICAGLGNMIADKVIEIMGLLPREEALVVGGVTRNSYVMQRLRERIKSVTVPEYADAFEALGAALYAMEQGAAAPSAIEVASPSSSFAVLPCLKEAQALVVFHEQENDIARDGDETILGLDVGSTTTKAVLLRTADARVLASVYLRTHGDPIGASRNCYREILNSLQGADVRILGLGVTGSGRHIAGLHAQTDCIVNEIIAHATAAAFFDPEVDTILEIGGQDAKYTYLINGVACDYAMNEACSAGTGSFLEEAARESLHIDVHDIQDRAIRAPAPPNFNDQCAAFIGSDIKNALHEISRDNIVAGLVYSICMNYNNRVRGPRKIGRKIFMQGGVCYNRAVPLAMASLLNKPVIVPPDPGLMGALGIALEARERLQLGAIAPECFNLQVLSEREAAYGKPFTCPGAKEACDRGCTIQVVKLEGKSYPFGGICNKYYNRVHHRQQTTPPAELDYVRQRQSAVFADVPAPAADPDGAGAQTTIGISRSFLTNLLYPLYYHFFTELGFRVVLSDNVDAQGVARTRSAFCYPAGAAHGMFFNLLQKSPDYIFLPRIHELHVDQARSREPGHQCCCITLQAEPFYLKSAFPEAAPRLLTPVLDFSAGWSAARKTFIDLASRLGRTRSQAARAMDKGLDRLQRFFEQRRELGRRALAFVEADPRRIGVVLFGRPYNAFADEINMGIPLKFASRDVCCIPFDSLPFQDEDNLENMTWAIGQDLIRAARYVKKNPQLYGAFLTNFSCGPDSFIVGYFRDIMKTKPSLTLEIDSHTADAGVNTRVEAFLEIVARYRKLELSDPTPPLFRKARLFADKTPARVETSDGRLVALTDPKVKVLIPSMGRSLAEAGAAALCGFGIRAEPVPAPTFKTLMCGRAHTSCKECLPLILTTGSLLEYVEHHRQPGEIIVYFMPTSNGSCRFPQYFVFMNKLIENKQIEDVVTLTLTSENSYGGLGVAQITQVLRAIMISDAMDDIKNAILALAVEPNYGISVWQEQWEKILAALAAGQTRLKPVLREVARKIAGIPRKFSLHEAHKVLLAGEIYVRKDEFSSQRVVENLARRGIVVHRAAILEWLKYVDLWVDSIEKSKVHLRHRIELLIRSMLMNRIEHTIKSALAESGFYENEPCKVEPILRMGEKFVDRGFAGGETILVIGRFFKEILREYQGMISIGPFACLPTRIIESILEPESRTRDNARLCDLPNHKQLRSVAKLPFLSIESDGNPFPQTIEAQIEAFSLQVERAHKSVARSRDPVAECGRSSTGVRWSKPRD